MAWQRDLACLSEDTIAMEPAEPTEEDIEAEIKALESGQFKWIEPGGFVDKTKKRIIELRAKLQMLGKKNKTR